MSLNADPTSGRTLVPEDLLQFAVIDDVAMAPEGNLVALTVRTADLPANQYYARLRIIPVDGSPPWALPAGEYADHAASWSPDGTRLAFLSDRTGKDQVWLTTMGGGEPRQLTSFPLGVSGHAVWSPDGSRLAIAAVEADDQDSGPAAIVASDALPFAVNTLCYRVDGKGYVGTRRQHLWVLDLETTVVTRLTEGLAGAYSPAWAPDGRHLAFVANRRDERLTEFRSAVWTVPSSGGAASRITPEEGVAQAPAWSPDGTEIAYRGLLSGSTFAPNHHLLLVSAHGDGTPRSLTGTFGGHVGGSLFSDTCRAGEGPPRLFWSPDGTTVRFLAADRGRVHILGVDRAGVITRLVGGDRSCGMLQVSDQGSILVYAAADFTHTPDLYVADAAGAGERRLSRLNPWLEEVRLSRPRPLSVAAPDGLALDAWLIPPAGGETPVAGPLVLDIHGGPHSIFGPAFFLDMQLLAARGFGVLLVNPRATRSYGDHFAACNLGHWGEGDAPDLLAALDAALKTGWVDQDRVGVMGLSYGGYMTNWLIGHTDRFRAAVSENSISNLVSFSGTSDIGWYFTPDEIGAEPWEDRERYLRLSPLSAADRIEIPLLLLNSQEDWRCPIEQAEQLYVALKRRGGIVEMVRFPGESHGMMSIGRPRSRLDRYRRVADWFATYV
ncbi:MAG TPA: S9 family peptidase [Chloroflexota bacterium]|nr:S9 family peptidase [Chloroflexota bacterium]